MARIQQRLGRAKVRSNPSCIYIASEECTVVLYVPSKRLDGDSGSLDNPEVIIRLDEAPAIPYGDEFSPTLPYDRAFPVYMEEGQQLWVVSPGESEVSFSVLPASLGALGY